MIKRSCLLLLLLLLALAGCSRPKPELHLFIWSEYIAPQIIADFERQFNCRVSVDLYEDNESMIAKLASGGLGLYDVVVPSEYVVTAMVQRGLLTPLRHESITNFANLEHTFTNLWFDPGNRYTVPYQWGTDGLYIRKPKTGAVEPTWGLVFDPAKQPGPFVLRDDMRICFEAALKYKGYSANSTDLQQLSEARDLLLDAKKRSLGFEAGIGGLNRVLSKGAVLAMATNGDAIRRVKEDPETFYFVPKEGSGIWLDNLAIPAQAPHRDLAEKFINYILAPNIGAQLSNYNQYPTPNRAARAFVNPADLQNPAIYPPEDTMHRLEFTHDLGDKTKLYDELWMQIKAR
jgi:spermidine/putrescine transport system substrate-binding protein